MDAGKGADEGCGLTMETNRRSAARMGGSGALPGSAEAAG